MTSSPRILLGVSGGIAAYKAAELVRLLGGRSFGVRCAMTRAATAFVTPLTLEILSGERVYTDDYLRGDGSGQELHIEAAQWADALCVAPATAHTLARLALGLADDFLSTAALAFEGPLILAPAMHSAMWAKETVSEHVALLRRRGARFVGPEVGPLASGETGPGRMSEPAEIAAAIEEALTGGALAGRTVLVSAGPTREALDPVRFLSNRSSGRMGFALAAAAARAGARTLLVAGPVALPTPRGAERIDVVTAAEMRDAVYGLAPEADLIVMAAAVADFRPARPAAQKIKKRAAPSSIPLEPTVDILAGLPAIAPQALLVGFAAETGDLESEARLKLETKEVDMLVANDVSRPDIGFESELNEVRILRPGKADLELARQPKEKLAEQLVDLCVEALEERDRKRAAADR